MVIRITGHFIGASVAVVTELKRLFYKEPMLGVASCTRELIHGANPFRIRKKRINVVHFTKRCRCLCYKSEWYKPDLPCYKPTLYRYRCPFSHKHTIFRLCRLPLE